MELRQAWEQPFVIHTNPPHLSITTLHTLLRTQSWQVERQRRRKQKTPFFTFSIMNRAFGLSLATWSSSFRLASSFSFVRMSLSSLYFRFSGARNSSRIFCWAGVATACSGHAPHGICVVDGDLTIRFHPIRDEGHGCQPKLDYQNTDCWRSV